MELAARTISPVPDISCHVGEGLVSSVSPGIFPGGNGGDASFRTVTPTCTQTLDSTPCAYVTPEHPALNIGRLAECHNAYLSSSPFG